MISFSIEGVLFGLVLVAVAVAVTLFWRIPVQRDIAWGTVRSFVQLVAVGYALRYIFAVDALWLTILVVMVMLTIGAATAGSSARAGRGTFRVCFLSMFVGSGVTVGLMLLTGIIDTSPRFVIPLAGMIVSNAMNSATLTINRLTADIRSHRAAIETALALGKSWREASRTSRESAAIAGMVSVLNFMKTVGLVALPGAMTGMILAGAEPLEAVFLQIIVAYMLLCAVALTAAVSLELSVRRFFTPQHQLRLD